MAIKKGGPYDSLSEAITAMVADAIDTSKSAVVLQEGENGLWYSIYDA